MRGKPSYVREPDAWEEEDDRCLALELMRIGQGVAGRKTEGDDPTPGGTGGSHTPALYPCGGMGWKRGEVRGVDK
jgi:hypothetical protein